MERIADVEKVLMNEIDNLHGVYLYLEGDSWCAYERSAYLQGAIRKVKQISYKKCTYNKEYQCVISILKGRQIQNEK